ncbi:POK9 protein, partial [Alectura lathami]|nr:POK9 protein [Alectura lathami]
AGSAVVALATAVATTLEDQSVHIIESNMTGPLGYGLSALLLGRSLISRQGIFIIPGVIDSDYTGVIKIMVYTPSPPVFIPADCKIAQLIPFKSCVPHAKSKECGDAGFGSTGMPQIMLAMDTLKSKPEIIVELQNSQQENIQLQMLIDTRADVTII